MRASPPRLLQTRLLLQRIREYKDLKNKHMYRLNYSRTPTLRREASNTDYSPPLCCPGQPRWPPYLTVSIKSSPSFPPIYQR